MCGIAGIWHPDGKLPDHDSLRRMTTALSHRGPDEEGFRSEPHIGLGHRRLSIIDLSTGQQPMCNEDGTIWVAFNGEIFNYIELRDDLERLGHAFRTRSDTETIVHLYEEYGLDAFEKLNGQFAIALWDRPRRRLILVRDRVGIRPLFHTTLPNGTVLFGSEIKALLAHGDVPAEIDPIALGQISMTWVTVPPRTPFKGIHELGPGRYLVFEAGRRMEKAYWQHEFPREGEYEERSLEHWIGEVRAVLRDAVRLQLRSDVPVATYLSGGLDSSILTAIVKAEQINDLTTYSVGFADERFDERRYQEEMIRHLRTNHRHLFVNAADIGDAFSDVIRLSERPIVRTAPAPLLKLAEMVRADGIKVVLTGEGADEIFGGYNIFREDKARRFWARAPRSRWRSLLLSNLYGYIARDAREETFWRRFFATDLDQIGDLYYSHRIRWRNAEHIRRFVHPDVRAEFQTNDELFSELDSYLGDEWKHWHPLCRAQYLEMTLFMSGYLLSSQGDRMMMGHSVEGRVPFLDHRLIELAARIPPKYKLRGLNEKYILKRAFEDLLPESITTRPKQPYRAPIASCFMRSAKNLGARLLDPAPVEAVGLLNLGAVEALRNKIGAPPAIPVSERDEMALAFAASTQILHHHFIGALPDEERAAI